MTRDELVEVMARAMAREAGHEPDSKPPGWPHVWWTEYAPEARAALSAMEALGVVPVLVEATEEMKQCGWGAGSSLYGGEPTFTADDAGELWRDMLAASPFREGGE